MNTTSNSQFGFSADAQIVPGESVCEGSLGRPREATLPIEVLHLINGEHFSGAERVQQRLAEQLPEFGFETHFACLKPGKFREFSGLPDSQITDTPMKGRFDLAVVDQLVELAFRERVGLLHAHTPRTALVASRVAKKTGLPWVYHVHSPTVRDSSRFWLNHVNALAERYAIRSCDMLVTVSKSLRREMLRLGVPRGKLVVVPNGVPPIEPIDPRERTSRQTWELGMVALMRPRKGVEVALSAMARLKSKGVPVRLRMIGGFETPQYETAMRRLQAAAELEDSVEWCGFQQDIAGEMRRLDGLVLPSLFGEGMPMVVLEALSAGIPVVATRVEGTPEVIRDGVEGFLANPADPESLADSIERMIESRERWADLSTAAVRRHRAGYSSRTMAQALARAYQQLLAHNRGT